MSKNRSKVIGGNFEREIAKKLSLWLTHNKDKDAVWHTKGSGARASFRSKNKEQTSKYDFGDLGPDDLKVNYFFDIFSIELKTGYGKKSNKETIRWSLLDLIDTKQHNPIFLSFWVQAETDAVLSEREPLLIFRRNNFLPCIAMNDYVFNSFIINENDFNSIIIKVFTKPQIIVVNLNSFFEYTSDKISESFINLNIKRAIMKYKTEIRD